MNKIQKEVKRYLEDRNWDKLRPSDVSKSICIEAAELLEIFQWESVEIEQALANGERMDKIKKELADIMIYCYEMCVLLKLDSDLIVENKLEHIKEKYPAKLMREKKPGNDLYWQIKHEHRKKGN